MYCVHAMLLGNDGTNERDAFDASDVILSQAMGQFQHVKVLQEMIAMLARVYVPLCIY